MNLKRGDKVEYQSIGSNPRLGIVKRVVNNRHCFCLVS